MSFQTMTWAVGHKLPALQKIVLLMLANRSNHETGKCVPKIKTLAEECGTSERSVQRAIQDLADAGLLQIVHRFHEGVQLSNQYNLCLWIRGELEIKAAPVAQHSHPVVPDSHPVETGWRTEPRIEPVIEPIPPTPKGAASRGTTLRIWLEDIKTKGEKAIPETDPVFAYAEKTGIPDEFLHLAWRVFKDQHTSGAGSLKRQKSWRQTFRTYVEKGYMRLWYINAEGQYALTTAGIQAQRAHEVAA